MGKRTLITPITKQAILQALEDGESRSSIKHRFNLKNYCNINRIVEASGQAGKGHWQPQIQWQQFLNQLINLAGQLVHGEILVPDDQYRTMKRYKTGISKLSRGIVPRDLAKLLHQ